MAVNSETTYQGFDCHNSITLINGYKLSEIDEITVADNGSIHQEEFEFVFSPVVEFRVSLEKHFDQGKVVIRLRQTHEKVEEAFCLTHNVDLGESPENYYCRATSGGSTFGDPSMEPHVRWKSHGVTAAMRSPGRSWLNSSMAYHVYGNSKEKWLWHLLCVGVLGLGQQQVSGRVS